MTRREHKERTTRIWYCYCTSHAGINCFRTSHLSVGLEKLSDVLPRPPTTALIKGFQRCEGGIMFAGREVGTGCPSCADVIR